MSVAQVAQIEPDEMIRQETAPALLAWYERSRRDLPWREAPGRLGDPYRVWLSEVMLQQTTVKAVIPYYRRFLERWPDVAALAAAEREEVLGLWAGLGYYSRANNLHDCARVIVEEFGGAFPETPDELVKLPGIGPYTAAAIAAMAFGEATTPVDGNIERVVARLFAIEEPLPGAKGLLKTLAEDLTPGYRAGDHAQAMMDLGATVCTPRRPSCMICPLEHLCLGAALSKQALLPKKEPKADRPVRYGYAFLALREDGKSPATQASARWSALEHDRGAIDGMERKCNPGECRPAHRAGACAMVGRAGHSEPHLHALSPGASGLPRRGCGRCTAHALGRTGALPMGPPQPPA